MLESLLAHILGPALAQGLTMLFGEGFFAVGAPLLLRVVIDRGLIPGLDQYSGKLLKAFAAVTAAAAAAGIKSSLDIGAGTFVVSGITSTGLGLFAADVVKQLGLQELAYQWLLKSRRS